MGLQTIWNWRHWLPKPLPPVVMLPVDPEPVFEPPEPPRIGLALGEVLHAAWPTRESSR